MTEICFNYNGRKTIIQCKNDDKMKDIYEKFATKTGADVSSLYFIYGGDTNINEDLTVGQIASKEDKLKNTMTILVNQSEVEDSQSSIVKSKEIICPKCAENAIINIQNYQINFECKNGHQTDNMLLEEYEKSQNIDISKIYCNKCRFTNKSETFNNIFHRCNICKMNLCPLCLSSHDKSHEAINYDNRIYVCEKHNQNYISYCKKCRKNICMLCDKEHNNHDIIAFGKLIPDIENLNIKLKQFQDKIFEFKNTIQDIIDKLHKIENNLESYYQINYDIISSYNNKKLNYELLQSFNQITINDTYEELNKIINDTNIYSKLKSIFDIYDKMYNKDPDKIKVIYKIKKDEIKDNKITIFNKNFVEKYKNICKIVVEGKSYELSEFFNLENCNDACYTLEFELKKIRYLTDLRKMFSGCKLLTALPDISEWNFTNVNNIEFMFCGCTSLELLSDISKWNMTNVTSMQSLFSGCNSIEKIPDISKWNLPNITKIDGMFSGCIKLSSIPDISKWDISKVTDLKGLFALCNNLTSVPDISIWNTKNVTSLRGLFGM